MKQALFVRAAACMAIAGGVLLSGCVSTSGQGGSQAPLLIAGETPRAILGSKEIARLDKNIPDNYRKDVRRAEAFGRMIHAYDRLARKAGELVAPGGNAPFSFPAAGWVTQRTQKGLRLSFVVKEQKQIGIAAEVTRMQSGGELETNRFSPPRSLSTRQLALWKARKTAYSSRFKPCARHYTPVIMIARISGQPFIYAFLLPASADSSTLYLGGYHRVVVSPDGNVTLENHAFTHGCITLHRREKDAVARVTEVINNSPTAPQVYASLRYDLPIRVKTLGNGLTWRIENGRITLVKTGGTKD